MLLSNYKIPCFFQLRNNLAKTAYICAEQSQNLHLKLNYDIQTKGSSYIINHLVGILIFKHLLAHGAVYVATRTVSIDRELNVTGVRHFIATTEFPHRGERPFRKAQISKTFKSFQFFSSKYTAVRLASITQAMQSIQH